MILKRYKLVILLVLLGIAGFFIRSNIAHTTPETTAINSFLADVHIAKVKDWAIYPNCDGAEGGDDEPYLLQANNVSTTSDKANDLKTAAKKRNYAVTERADGYEIKTENWSIVALTKQRSDLFLTIWYQQKPKGFSEGSQTCS